jgi:hypothetical protein
MGKNVRYYRQATASVLRFYVEFEDGLVQSNNLGPIFDPRVLDYRIDVERILARELSQAECSVLLAIHRDGLSHAAALKVAAITARRPDNFVVDLEVRAGRAFIKHKLLDFLSYFRR